MTTLFFKELHSTLVGNEIFIGDGDDHGQIHKRNSKARQDKYWNFLHNFDVKILNELIGNAKAFQKQKTESTQGQVRQCNKSNNTLGLIFRIPRQGTVQESKQCKNVAA